MIFVWNSLLSCDALLTRGYIVLVRQLVPSPPYGDSAQSAAMLKY